MLNQSEGRLVTIQRSKSQQHAQVDRSTADLYIHDILVPGFIGLGVGICKGIVTMIVMICQLVFWMILTLGRLIQQTWQVLVTAYRVTNSFAMWLFTKEPRTKAQERFKRTYCVLVGVMCAFIVTGMYANYENADGLRAEAALSAYAYKAAFEEAQPLITLGQEVRNGERTVSVLQEEGPMGMIIASESHRLGCQIHVPFIESYFSAVKTIESSGRYFAAHNTSRAYGFYAFKPASKVDTARYGVGYTERMWGFTPIWISSLAGSDGTGVQLREDQMKVLVLFHAIMRTGSDEHLRKALCNGNLESAKILYGRFHHTAPDPKTQRLVDQQFGYKWPNSRQIQTIL